MKSKIKRYLERLGWKLDDIRDRISTGWEKLKWAMMCTIWPRPYTNLYARYRSLIEICNARDEEYQTDYDKWAEEKTKLTQEIKKLKKELNKKG